MKTMKALVAQQYGQPETYRVVDVPVPAPAAGEILVRVHASAVNMADLRVARGDLRNFVQLPFPHVLGADFAGTVIEVGADVNRYAVGDEVFGYTTAAALAPFGGPNSPTGTGSMAEYLTVKADTPFVGQRPPQLDAISAAALATTGLTARAIGLTANLRDGERVLVVGATGAVGTALLSLLSRYNVDITATSRPDQHEAVRKLGAHHTIGFDPAEYPTDVDVVLNAALPGNALTPLVAVLRPGGRLLTVVPPPPSPSEYGRPEVDITYVADADGNLGGMKELSQLALAGGIRAVVAKTVPLSDAAEAYADFAQGGLLGKLTVVPDF